MRIRFTSSTGMVLCLIQSSVLFLSLLLFPLKSTAEQTPESPRGQSQPVTQQPLLNSERIRQQFGSYGIEILQADERLRVSNLYSLNDGQKITRTLAIVLFPEDIPETIQQEHQLIISGGSIGEVFKSHGWQVEKENLYLGELQASQAYAGVYELMGGISATDLAMHVYEFSVHKKGDVVVYAIIAEVHHPDYLQLEELETIYSGNEAEAEIDQNSNPMLETIRQSLSGF